MAPRRELTRGGAKYRGGLWASSLSSYFFCHEIMIPRRGAKHRRGLWVSSIFLFLFLQSASNIRDLHRRLIWTSEQYETDYNRPSPNSLMSRRKHPNDETRINRIYFINLDTNPGRRAFMEGWLSKQTIPFERITGKVGDPSSDTCVEGKTEPKRCRGIAGLAKTEVSIIDSYDTTGLTFVMEDDYYAENITRLQESISVVPDDWDIIRFNCRGHHYIPSDFPFLHVEPGNELQIEKVFETRHNKEQPPCKNGMNEERCWFCGGTHAMVWRGSRVQKLRKVWSRKPYDDIDCSLTDQKNLKSYCINFRNGREVIPTQIKGEITNIPQNLTRVRTNMST
jgi:hypothetical protein